jgi:hypothetical protein
MPEINTCAQCGYPFSKLRNLKAGTDQIRAKVGGVNLEKFGFGKLWLNFWIYVRLPLGALLTAIIGLSFPLLFLYSLFIVFVAVGLHLRRFDAWQANWVLVFEPVATTILVPIINNEGSEKLALSFLIALMLCVVWVAPNWIYFKKRKPWFVQSDRDISFV